MQTQGHRAIICQEASGPIVFTLIARHQRGEVGWGPWRQWPRSCWSCTVMLCVGPSNGGQSHCHTRFSHIGPTAATCLLQRRDQCLAMRSIFGRPHHQKVLYFPGRPVGLHLALSEGKERICFFPLPLVLATAAAQQSDVSMRLSSFPATLQDRPAKNAGLETRDGLVSRANHQVNSFSSYSRHWYRKITQGLRCVSSDLS